MPEVWDRLGAWLRIGLAERAGFSGRDVASLVQDVVTKQAAAAAAGECRSGDHSSRPETLGKKGCGPWTLRGSEGQVDAWASLSPKNWLEDRSPVAVSERLPTEPAMLRSKQLVSILLSVALASCASSPPSAATATSPGYDLRIDGDAVSLALSRGLSVPEFLQLAQQVTNARYVYRPDQVAGVGPVTLMGEIRCRRAEFPDFVGKMLHIHGLRAEPRGSGDTQYVEIVAGAKG